MSEERRLAVLRAIVEDYVATEEPVGSKTLVERHGLGVSPATVRNDMAVLEEEGFIHQPHTSAGRVPTDKGYRLFVDRLTGIKPMSAAEKRAITTILDGAVDLDDVVRRSVRLLSQLTHQLAIVQYPFDTLKVDRVLVGEAPGSEKSRQVMRSLVGEPGADDLRPTVSEDVLRTVGQHLLRRALAAIRRARHGGTLLIVPPGEQGDLEVPGVTLKYRFVEHDTRRRFRQLILSIVSTLQDVAVRDGVDRGLEGPQSRSISLGGVNPSGKERLSSHVCRRGDQQRVLCVISSPAHQFNQPGRQVVVTELISDSIGGPIRRRQEGSDLAACAAGR